MVVQRLKTIAHVIAGQSPSSDDVKPLEEGIPFIQGNAEFGSLHPIPKWECSTATKFAEPGDILVSVRAPVGEVNIADTKIGIGRGLAAIRPKDASLSKWLYFALLSNKEYLNSIATGSTFTAVTASEIGNIRLTIPENPEAIADELDCELAEIDEFIADQIKLKKLLKEQFEAQKEQIILEAGGKQVRLSRVLKGLKDGTHGTHIRVDSGGEVLLSAKNISSGELVISEDESRISLEEAAQITASGFPRKGDVMMILVGATYGRTALYNLEQTLPFQRSVGFFRPNNDLITSDYLKLTMSSREFQQQLSLGIKTSAQPGIYLGDVASCTISLPNRSSQVSVVNKYQSAEKIYNEITADINKSIECLIESRNRLLSTSLY